MVANLFLVGNFIFVTILVKSKRFRLQKKAGQQKCEHLFLTMEMRKRIKNKVFGFVISREKFLTDYFGKLRFFSKIGKTSGHPPWFCCRMLAILL